MEKSKRVEMLKELFEEIDQETQDHLYYDYRLIEAAEILDAKEEKERLKDYPYVIVEVGPMSSYKNDRVWAGVRCRIRKSFSWGALKAYSYGDIQLADETKVHIHGIILRPVTEED